MKSPHYVHDYEQLVKDLKKNFTLDDAMSHAVGGAYKETGETEHKILAYAGLEPHSSLVDVGCGSGRLASALGKSDFRGSYIGTDVVQDLLDYAREKCPPHFQFYRHTELSIPAQDNSIDFVCAFSVFTHLHHEESYIYIEDARRVLKSGGKLVFSFLEFATDHHWTAFQATIDARRNGTLPHLNMFIERNAISLWAHKIGFNVQEFIEGADAPWGGNHLGQTTVILSRN